MPEPQISQRVNDPRKGSRIPQGSIFFEKIVPILLIGMGVLTFLLILFAAGVLIGLIRF